MAETLQYDEW